MVLKYIKEFLTLVFGFIVFVSLLAFTLFLVFVPFGIGHYLELQGYNGFVIYSSVIAQYMIMYIVARALNIFDDETFSL
jgi:hypothetical protein